MGRVSIVTPPPHTHKPLLRPHPSCPALQSLPPSLKALITVCWGDIDAEWGGSVSRGSCVRLLKSAGRMVLGNSSSDLVLWEGATGKVHARAVVLKMGEEWGHWSGVRDA